MTSTVQSMVYHERTTWAALAANFAVWLPYFLYMTWLFAWGTYTPVAGLSALVGAIILASVNIFGGFIVTRRMLSMFKKKTR